MKIVKSTITRLIFFIVFICCFCCCFCTPTIHAETVGVYGSVYPIGEEDLLAFIQKRLLQLEKNGSFDQLQSQFTAQVEQHILRPTPVDWLTTTQTTRVFSYDPTLVVTRDIPDATGRVIIAKGTTVNPLDALTLHEILLFLDADDPRQLKWAQNAFNQITRANPDYLIKYILIRGDIEQTSHVLSHNIYFDQEGILSKKFGLQHVPAIIWQTGRVLTIEEISINQLKGWKLPVLNTSSVNIGNPIIREKPNAT